MNKNLSDSIFYSALGITFLGAYAWSLGIFIPAAQDYWYHVPDPQIPLKGFILLAALMWLCILFVILTLTIAFRNFLKCLREGQVRKRNALEHKLMDDWEA